MNWLQPSILVTEMFISTRSFGKLTEIPWHEILELRGEKVSKITYDENYMIIIGRNEKTISVGELDKGFESALQELEKRFNIASDWRARLEELPIGTSSTIWKIR